MNYLITADEKRINQNAVNNALKIKLTGFILVHRNPLDRDDLFILINVIPFIFIEL
jgi:hypothetical protein